MIYWKAKNGNLWLKGELCEITNGIAVVLFDGKFYKVPEENVKLP